MSRKQPHLSGVVVCYLVGALVFAGIFRSAAAKAWRVPQQDLVDQEKDKKEEKKDEKKEEKKGLQLKPERKIEFTTDEGTWLSLDVSPDGKTIVFELVGDIYTLPIEGGEAKLI